MEYEIKVEIKNKASKNIGGLILELGSDIKLGGKNLIDIKDLLVGYINRQDYEARRKESYNCETHKVEVRDPTYYKGQKIKAFEVGLDKDGKLEEISEIKTKKSRFSRTKISDIIDEKLEKENIFGGLTINEFLKRVKYFSNTGYSIRDKKRKQKKENKSFTDGILKTVSDSLSKISDYAKYEIPCQEKNRILIIIHYILYKNTDGKINFLKLNNKDQEEYYNYFMKLVEEKGEKTAIKKFRRRTLLINKMFKRIFKN